MFLFTNEAHGEPFVLAARTLAQERNIPLTVVLPAQKQKAPRRGLSEYLTAVRLALRNARRAHWNARRWRIRVQVAKNVNSDAFIRKIPRDSVGLVAGFSQIFRAPAIDRFRWLVNCHGSLLPYFRGPMPTYWCLQYGERETGFTFHHVTTDLDAGEIIWQDVVPVHPGDDPDTLYVRIIEGALQPFRNLIVALIGNGPLPRQTIDAGRHYQHRVDYLSFPEREAGTGLHG